jgi:hypothetical protein
MPRAQDNDMTPYRQRQGFRITRGWAALLVLALALLAGAYWLGPMTTPPPELELVVMDDGRPVVDISARGYVDAREGVLRIPLQLAVRNAGPRPARPQQIALHVPGQFRVATARGRLPGDVAQGVPLRRYVLPVSAPPVAPDAPPVPLPGLDTIWLEPDLPRYYCVARTNNVPEFMPAPQYDPGALAQLQIFYSVRSGGQRSTGLLNVNLDPAQLAVQPAEMPPTFPTVFEEPQAQVPELGALRYGGSRTAWCGDPERPMELYVVTWITAANGRFYVIHVQGEPRKHLYDLNGDGTIELETWDVTGDGRFEARRQARFAVPEFLQPLPQHRDALLPDTVRPDSVWLALFHNAAAGPLRFTRQPQRAVTDEGLPVIAGVPVEPLPPPDSAWLALFLDAQSGPFRFSRGTRPATAEPQPAAEPPPPAAEPSPPPADDVPAAPPVAEPEPEPEPEPVQPQRRAPLGTPVPSRPGSLP